MSNHEGFPSDGEKLINASQLEPLQVTGVTIVTIGTVIWAVAFLFALVFRNWLIAHGHHDWVWIALAGTVLGLLGIGYTTRRANRLAKLSK